MPLLEVKNLNIDFPILNGVFKAVKNVSFYIESGEIVGIVGESGAGKSTIGNGIINLLSPPGRVTSGKVQLNEKMISNLDQKQIQEIRGRDIGFIFQDPMTSLNPIFTMENQIMETLIQNLSMSKTEAKQKALQALDDVGIPDPELSIKQYPHQFSGGMRQRVVIAIALCCEPQLIIADEPTTALDVSIQDQILNLIKNLCKKKKIGVILVTHDMGVISNTADRVIVMANGEIKEQGSTKQIIEEPKHPYTKSLIASVPLSKVKLKRFHLVDSTESDALKKINIKTHWLGKKKEKTNESKFILKVQDVTLTFIKKNAIFKKNIHYLHANKNVSFEVKKGETFGLVGESGSGKSTIARVITGLYKPTKGNIYFNETNLFEVSAIKRKLFYQEIQMIFQNPYASLSPRMTIKDIISEPIYCHKLAKKSEVEKIVEDLLEHVGLHSKDKSKYPHEFSGGQRQRISIARALATRPNLLICDEPTSALDVSVQAKILNLLKDLQDELGLSILFISHDLPVIRQMCDRIAVMKSGEILEISETEKLFKEPTHPYTKKLLDLMPALDKLKT